jgi:hypothetical protein
MLRIFGAVLVLSIGSFAQANDADIAKGAAGVLAITMAPFVTSASSSTTTNEQNKYALNEQKVRAAQSDAQVYVQSADAGVQPQMTLRIAEGLKALEELNPEAASLSQDQRIYELALYNN